MGFDWNYPRRASRSGGDEIDRELMEGLVGTESVIIYKNQFWKIEKSTPKLFKLCSFMNIKGYAKKDSIGKPYIVKLYCAC